MPAEWTFHRGETSHTLVVESWNVTRSRSDGLRWSVVLSNSAYWPGGAQGQYFEPYEQTGGSFNTWVECTLTAQGETWNSPKLAILDVAWDQQPNALKCELSGTDAGSELLLYEGVTLGDRRSTSGLVYTAAGIIEEVCGACAIDGGALVFTDFSDYNVPVFHAVGQGMELVKSLLQLMQGWIYPNGSNLEFRDGGIDISAGSADITLTESNSKVVQYRKSSNGIYNEATFERTSETKYGYGPEILYGRGTQTINLDNPLNEAILIVNLKGSGYTENWTWYDADDNPLVVSPQKIYRGPTPAAKVQFSVTPSLAWGDNDMAFEVEIKGHNSIDEVAPFEEDYASTYTDTADQAVRGELPYPEPQVSEQCPDQATGLIAATKLVRENLLNYCSLNADLLLNPAHDPGMKAAATYPKLALSSKRFLVETVQWSGDANQEIETLELARGAA